MADLDDASLSAKDEAMNTSTKNRVALCESANSDDPVPGPEEPQEVDQSELTTSAKLKIFESANDEPKNAEEEDTNSTKAKAAMFEPPPPETKAKAAMFESSLKRPAASTGGKKPSVMAMEQDQKVSKLKDQLSATLNQNLMKQMPKIAAKPKGFASSTSAPEGTVPQPDEPGPPVVNESEEEEVEECPPQSMNTKMKKFETGDEGTEEAPVQTAAKKKLSVLKVSDKKQVTNLMTHFSASLEQALQKQKDKPKGTSTRRDSGDEERVMDAPEYLDDPQFDDNGAVSAEEEESIGQADDLEEVQLDVEPEPEKEPEPEPEPEPAPKRRLFCGCF